MAHSRIAMLPSEYVPGATVVGMTFKDGVVLAAEKRFTYGKFIMSKTGKKVFKITDKVGAACAGMISDMQVLVRNMQALIKLRELDVNRPSSPSSVAKLMSILMFENRLLPLLTQVIVGGVGEKPEIYVLDPLGSLIKDQYACVGTGAETAIGMIEAEYKADISEEEAKKLAIKAIKSAIQRDASSGDGVDMLIITREGVKEETVQF
jgi:proteasome beta subunit